MKPRQQQLLTFAALLLLTALEIVIALQGISVAWKFFLLLIAVIFQIALLVPRSPSRRFYLYSFLPVLLLLLSLILALLPDSFRERDHKGENPAMINSAR